MEVLTPEFGKHFEEEKKQPGTKKSLWDIFVDKKEKIKEHFAEKAQIEFENGVKDSYDFEEIVSHMEKFYGKNSEEAKFIANNIKLLDEKEISKDKFEENLSFPENKNFKLIPSFLIKRIIHLLEVKQLKADLGIKPED